MFYQGLEALQIIKMLPTYCGKRILTLFPYNIGVLRQRGNFCYGYCKDIQIRVGSSGKKN